MTATSPTFFSYSRDDSEFALTLAKDLRSAGAHVWLDQLDIKPGQRWDRAIEDALATCRKLLVVLSPASMDSTNVMDEVSLALEENKIVIPVIYRDCKVPFRLRRLQHVDFRSDYGKALAQLIESFDITPSHGSDVEHSELATSNPYEITSASRSDPVGTASREQPVSKSNEALDGIDRNVELVTPLDLTHPGDLGMHARSEIQKPYLSILDDTEPTSSTSSTLIRRLMTVPRSVVKGAIFSGALWTTIPLLHYYQFLGSIFIGDNWRWQPGSLLSGLYLAIAFGWFESHAPKLRFVLLLVVWPLALALAGVSVPVYEVLDFTTFWLYRDGHSVLFVGLVSIAGALTGSIVAWPVKSRRWTGAGLGAMSFGVTPLLVPFLFRWFDSYFLFFAIVSHSLTGFVGPAALLWWMSQPVPSAIEARDRGALLKMSGAG